MGLFRIAVASAAAAVLVSGYVPPHMELPVSWTDVSKATLIPLEFKSEASSVIEGDGSLVKESECMSATDVISNHSGPNGCITFAVRRPGWVLCREEGRAIANLATREDMPLDGFGIFGVVKEVGVDDEGLVEFQSNFFPYPLYRDELTTFYTALGSRKIALKSWNPIKLFRSFRELSKRLKQKNISGNMKGDGIVQGGIIIFDKNGKARYAYREETGSEVPISDILAAVKEVKAETL